MLDDSREELVTVVVVENLLVDTVSVLEDSMEEL